LVFSSSFHNPWKIMRSYPNPLLQSGQVKKSGVPVWIYPLTGKESGCLGD
jgi:hypothetical protein